MNWLPGWGSIESTGWWSNFHFWFGMACLFLLAITEVLSHVYTMRRDNLVVEEQTHQEQVKEKSHSDEVAKLKMQLEQTSQQVAADHSLKNQLRNLLTSIDPQILREIDAGHVDLTIRMQPRDFGALEKLLAEPGGGKLILIKGRGQKMVNSSINNGTLGPQGAVPLQEQIMVSVLPAMKVIN